MQIGFIVEVIVVSVVACAFNSFATVQYDLHSRPEK